VNNQKSVQPIVDTRVEVFTRVTSVTLLEHSGHHSHEHFSQPAAQLRPRVLPLNTGGWAVCSPVLDKPGMQRGGGLEAPTACTDTGCSPRFVLQTTRNETSAERGDGRTTYGRSHEAGKATSNAGRGAGWRIAV